LNDILDHRNPFKFMISLKRLDNVEGNSKACDVR